MQGKKYYARITDIQLADVPCMRSDKNALQKFTHGEAVAKGFRHMELRMWYVRQRYKQGDVLIDWMLKYLRTNWPSLGPEKHTRSLLEIYWDWVYWNKLCLMQWVRTTSLAESLRDLLVFLPPMQKLRGVLEAVIFT